MHTAWLVVFACLVALALAATGCDPSATIPEGPSKPRTKTYDDVSAESLKGSVHANIDCADCHGNRGATDKKGVSIDCDHCHQQQAKLHEASVHGVALAHGENMAAECQDCHGAHDIVKVDDPKSRVFKLRLPFTCAKCHSSLDIGDIRAPHAASQYLDSTHGRALLKDGLIVAPSCSDCHGGAHEMLRANNEQSKVHHTNIPATCAKCHVGIQEQYETSVHGRLLSAGDARGPVCTDCHTSHQIDIPEVGSMKLAIDARCGQCHADRLERYRETYHGRAIHLGEGKVAACFDCHGHHDIRPMSDPASLLHANNRLKTCQQCHADAPPKFAGYMAHGDHSDRENYPQLYFVYFAMTGLLIGVFFFFGFHTLLWFARSVVFMIRNPDGFKQERKLAREHKQGKVFVRFRPVDRFNHFLVIISFLLLVATGMPLKFYYTGWAQTMFNWMGGAQAAAALHRLGAVITLIYFIVHVGSVIESVWARRGTLRNESGKLTAARIKNMVFGPDSPMPNRQDLRDFVAHNKWFFGRGPRPTFDRWTYWEKFDYLAVFWGVFIIGMSGLVMWFPETATLLLPGWGINVAHIIHSDEALLAAGFIFTFHFFNVHFRVEKFPMDPVIFSGRITEGELMHERGRLYDRLKASGELDKTRVKDEWESWKRIFVPIGMLAFGIGVILIVAIYIAMASRLTHG